MYAMIEDEQLATGGYTQKGRDLTKMMQQLRGALDAQVPEYKAARDAWGGPSAYMNAVRNGQDILRGYEEKAVVRTAEEDVAFFNNLSESEKQADREGAVTAIIAKMER